MRLVSYLTLGYPADLGWVCSTSFIGLTTDRTPSVQQVGVAWVPDDHCAGIRTAMERLSVRVDY